VLELALTPVLAKLAWRHPKLTVEIFVNDALVDIVAQGLRYLPPYSPDLNPIENSYSVFKTFLRKCAERTEEALRRRAGQFVRRLPAKTCAKFFAHSGYAAT
jgi:transposase